MVKDADKPMVNDFRGYTALLGKIRQRVQVAQQRAIYAANEEMLRMYWDIENPCTLLVHGSMCH